MQVPGRVTGVDEPASPRSSRLRGAALPTPASEEGLREALERVRASEQLLRAVLQTAVDAILVVDAGRQVLLANVAAERLFGRGAGELAGEDVEVLLEELAHDEGSPSAFPALGKGPREGHLREVLGRRPDGTPVAAEITVSQLGGPEGLLTYLVRDVTARRAFEVQLAHDAVHDPLTGLGNRLLLMERLELALARQARRPSSLAVLFLDLDGFKQVNDALGHEGGDMLLVAVAGRLRRAVRPEDLVVRLGGDEFVVLCEDLAEPGNGEDIADRLVREVSQPFVVHGRRVAVSASVGVTTDMQDRTAAELLRNVDAAMYQAKAQGPGRYRTYAEPGGAGAATSRLLGAQVREAVERGQLLALYQPLVDLGSGAVLGAEALVRWEHPELGLLLPAAFLPLAEESEVICQIDRWMLRTACQAAAGWTRALGRALGVCVNVSARSLTRSELPGWVAGALADAGLAARQLTVEVAESALRRDLAASGEAMAGLRGLGVQLSVDGFGSGDTSLAQFQHVPVQVLKVDRRPERVRSEESCSPDGPDEAVVRAVIALAHGFGLRAAATGIETSRQLDLVSVLGGDVGQGFLLGRPVRAEDVPGVARHPVDLRTRDRRRDALPAPR